MGSHHIKIYGQHQGYRNGSRTVMIDRQLPPPLTTDINQHEWLSFCAAIDKKLVPLSRLKLQMLHRMTIFMKFAFAIGLVLVAWCIWKKSLTAPIYLLAALTLGPILFHCFLLRCKMTITKNVARKLEKVCRTHSEKTPNVTFIRREEKHYNWNRSVHTTFYIECKIGPVPTISSAEEGTAGSGVILASVASVPLENPPTAVLFPVPSTASDVDVASIAIPMAPQRDMVQRLHDLNRISALLTEEEYNNCEKMILSGNGDNLDHWSEGGVVERLESLENTRSRMSETEYVSKRMDILKSV